MSFQGDRVISLFRIHSRILETSLGNDLPELRRQDDTDSTLVYVPLNIELTFEVPSGGPLSSFGYYYYYFQVRLDPERHIVPDHFRDELVKPGVLR